MSGIEIVHISQLLEQNLSNAASKLEKPLRIAYHDPCSLGRHAKVFDAPRNVLKAIEGVTLVELPAAREFSTCCGGGGGVSVVHPDVAANIAAKKLRRELAHLGVDVLVTCCPMCLLSFRRALAKLKSPVKVMDLAEVVALSVS